MISNGKANENNHLNPPTHTQARAAHARRCLDGDGPHVTRGGGAALLTAAGPAAPGGHSLLRRRRPRDARRDEDRRGVLRPRHAGEACGDEDGRGQAGDAALRPREARHVPRPPVRLRVPRRHRLHGTVCGSP
jgi:hypothetical protein